MKMYIIYALIVGNIIKNWQGMTSISKRSLRGKDSQDNERIRTKREILFSVKAVDGDAKTSIQFYGLDRPLLEVCLFEKNFLFFG